MLYLALLALHLCPLDVQPRSRVSLQTQRPDLPVQIFPSVLQCPRLVALLGNFLVEVRVFYLLANSFEAASLLFDVTF